MTISKTGKLKLKTKKLSLHRYQSPDASLEESAAPVAGGDAVVLPTRLVPTDLAQNFRLLVHSEM